MDHEAVPGRMIPRKDEYDFYNALSLLRDKTPNELAAILLAIPKNPGNIYYDTLTILLERASGAKVGEPVLLKDGSPRRNNTSKKPQRVHRPRASGRQRKTT